MLVIKDKIYENCHEELIDPQTFLMLNEFRSINEYIETLSKKQA